MQNLATSINRLVQFLNSQFSPPSQKPWSELPRWGVVFGRTPHFSWNQDLGSGYISKSRKRAESWAKISKCKSRWTPHSRLRATDLGSISAAGRHDPMVRPTDASVSGLYRQPGMPETVCWVGWFGIRPRFRRQGVGTRAMYLLWDFARSVAGQALWVYTGSSDDIAVRFYKSLGFEVLGTAAQSAHGQTMDDSDIILRRML